MALAWDQMDASCIELLKVALDQGWALLCVGLLY